MRQYGMKNDDGGFGKPVQKGEKSIFAFVRKKTKLMLYQYDLDVLVDINGLGQFNITGQVIGIEGIFHFIRVNAIRITGFQRADFEGKGIAEFIVKRFYQVQRIGCDATFSWRIGSDE